MRRLLVINPNTTAAITELLGRHAQDEAGGAADMRAITAHFGAPYIVDEASYAVAGHATLDAWRMFAPRDGWTPDALLIGCFGDPALFALREVASERAVTGLAEASFTEAAAHGRFAVVTGGARWQPMLQRLADALGFHDTLAVILTVAPSGAELAANPAMARAVLAQACQSAVAQYGVRAVVLGGAGLAGMAAEIQAEVPVAVIDSVRAGVRVALQRCAA